MNNTTAFPNLVITNVVYLGNSFEDSRSFTVPNRIYIRGSERAATVEEALEILFRELNVVDGTELISDSEFRATWPNLRSMSVGDTVTFRGPGGWRRTFVCEGMGWAEISFEEAVWLAEKVTSRDFWGTFAETRRRIS